MYIQDRKIYKAIFAISVISISILFIYFVSTATLTNDKSNQANTTTADYEYCLCGYNECIDGRVCYYETELYKKTVRPVRQTDDYLNHTNEPSSCEAEVVVHTSETTVEETKTVTETTTQEQYSVDAQRSFYGKCYVTGYCTGACCCGKWAGTPTASGLPATAWKTVAMYDIPFGTRIYIDGLGEFVVEDRGVGAGKVDVCVGYNGDHADAYKITGYYDVYILN